MMKQSLVILPVLASMFMANEADAHWQYTKFGMSPDEVVYASGNSAVHPIKPDTFPADDNLFHLLSADYSAGDFDFDARFNFDGSNRLVAVVLYLKDLSKCSSLVGTLTNTYGPAKISPTKFATYYRWWDYENMNDVLYDEFLDTQCTIQYKPINKKNESGGL